MLRGSHYVLVRPHVLLVATGAREKSLVFKGNTLPGVYGAGAFQTLVNRDLVRPAERLFVVGGGNVGLIGAYHALQAGIQVVGLCEALDDCGGYKVHKDKLVRMGVPIHTRHTIVSANGKEEVESVTIAKLDPSWKVVPGTEKTFRCDTLLVAVGLDPVDEFLKKAKEFGLPVLGAGDAEEIAEASAAMFTGKIKGTEIARMLGRDVGEVPAEWLRTAEVLKARPGAVITEEIPEHEAGVFPIFHCSQEIPCNPCTSICPKGAIKIEGDDILGLPTFDESACIACEQCVAICPGLAVTLVDYRKKDAEGVLVSIPFEFPKTTIKEGDMVTVLDTLGKVLGHVPVAKVRSPKFADHALLVKVKAPREIAKLIAGIQVQAPWVSAAMEEEVQRIDDDDVVCRCERVTAGEIRRHIREGVRDLNHLKALTRAGMGACGGKTCPSLIARVFREEGVPLAAGDAADAAPRLHGGAARRVRGRRHRRGADEGRRAHLRRTARGRRVMTTSVYDAVVVGAGSVGMPTAMYLAEKGLKVLCVDQFASRGAGQQQGRHRRPARHALLAREDPPLPRLAEDVLHLEGERTASTSSGARAGTCSSPTAPRRRRR